MTHFDELDGPRFVTPPFPAPPICDHPERPRGKPLCVACFVAWKPSFDAWRNECEGLRGVGHA